MGSSTRTNCTITQSAPLLAWPPTVLQAPRRNRIGPESVHRRAGGFQHSLQRFRSSTIRCRPDPCVSDPYMPPLTATFAGENEASTCTCFLVKTFTQCPRNWLCRSRRKHTVCHTYFALCMTRLDSRSPPSIQRAKADGRPIRQELALHGLESYNMSQARVGCALVRNCPPWGLREGLDRACGGGVGAIMSGIELLKPPYPVDLRPNLAQMSAASWSMAAEVWEGTLERDPTAT